MSVLNQSGEEQVECPLCMEPLEVDDLNFYPCTCGYQICRFCWHRIRTDENGLCPACRKAYSEKPTDFTPLSKEQVAQLKAEKRARDQQRKARLTESRKHLASVRVVQKNLVFVVGLPVRLADPDMLRRHEYFGKYGRIHKVVINQSTAYAGAQGPSASAYVTYFKSEDALRAIQSVNNITLDGRQIKSSLGTTKYCSHFLKNQPCPKGDCMYLHELGDSEASFTKEEMHQGKHQEYEKRLHDQLANQTVSKTTKDNNTTGSTKDGSSNNKNTANDDVQKEEKEAWPSLSRNSSPPNGKSGETENPTELTKAQLAQMQSVNKILKDSSSNSNKAKSSKAKNKNQTNAKDKEMKSRREKNAPSSSSDDCSDRCSFSEKSSSTDSILASTLMENELNLNKSLSDSKSSNEKDSEASDRNEIDELTIALNMANTNLDAQRLDGETNDDKSKIINSPNSLAENDAKSTQDVQKVNYEQQESLSADNSNNESNLFNDSLLPDCINSNEDWQAAFGFAKDFENKDINGAGTESSMFNGSYARKGFENQDFHSNYGNQNGASLQNGHQDFNNHHNVNSTTSNPVNSSIPASSIASLLFNNSLTNSNNSINTNKNQFNNCENIAALKSALVDNLGILGNNTNVSSVNGVNNVNPFSPNPNASLMNGSAFDHQNMCKFLNEFHSNNINNIKFDSIQQPESVTAFLHGNNANANSGGFNQGNDNLLNSNLFNNDLINQARSSSAGLEHLLSNLQPGNSQANSNLLYQQQKLLEKQQLQQQQLLLNLKNQQQNSLSNQSFLTQGAYQQNFLLQNQINLVQNQHNLISGDQHNINVIGNQQNITQNIIGNTAMLPNQLAAVASFLNAAAQQQPTQSAFSQLALNNNANAPGVNAFGPAFNVTSPSGNSSVAPSNQLFNAPGPFGNNSNLTATSAVYNLGMTPTVTSTNSDMSQLNNVVGSHSSVTSSVIDDELGFDPFHETQKGFAEMMSESNVSNSNSNPSSEQTAATLLQQQQALSASLNQQRSARHPPPGFSPHMNAFGIGLPRPQAVSKILPFMGLGQNANNASSVQATAAALAALNHNLNSLNGGNLTSNWNNQSHLGPSTGPSKALGVDWTTLDPAIVSSSRHFPLVANMGQLRDQYQTNTGAWQAANAAALRNSSSANIGSAANTAGGSVGSGLMDYGGSNSGYVPQFNNTFNSSSMLFNSTMPNSSANAAPQSQHSFTNSWLNLAAGEFPSGNATGSDQQNMTTMPPGFRQNTGKQEC